MKATIKEIEFSVNLDAYFSAYGERHDNMAWRLKNFLKSLDERSPTVNFIPEHVFTYRGKTLPRVRFVVQNYPHLGGWSCYVTTDSSLASLTPGARKFMLEMFCTEIAEITPSLVPELIKQTKQNAKLAAVKALEETIERAKKELAEVQELN